VKLLEHGLSRYGLHTLTEKVVSIISLKPPKISGELYRLIGMFGYYRLFIYQFAKIAKLINDLKKSTVDNDLKKSTMDSSSGTRLSRPDKCPCYNSKQPIQWNKRCQLAFDELKR